MIAARQHVKSLLNIVYRPEFPEICLVDFYLPDTDSPAPLLVYLHGGGLEAGNRHCSFLYNLPEKYGIAVASVEYRMYPDAHYPHFVDDCAASVSFIRSYAREHLPYLDVGNRLFVGGSSAGGYLSMMLCFAPRFLGEYGMKPTDIAGYIHDAGQPTVHFNILREHGMDTRLVRIDDSAPIWYIDHTPKPEDVPRMCILYSENDIPNRPEQTALLYRTMAHFEYPMEKIELHYFPGYGHCGYLQVNDTDGINVFCKTAALFILGKK